MIRIHGKNKTITKETKIVLSILHSGIKAGNPSNYLKKYVQKNQIIICNKKYNLKKYDNVYLISFGKSADLMAKELNSIIKIKKGIMVIPEKYTSLLSLKKFQIIKSGHPVPNTKSVFAAKKILSFLKNVPKNDFVIFCVSGGGSSLLSLPDGISLSEKQKLTKSLLSSGATIQEINCIRKHLSLVKGGRLVEHLKCDGLALILSDVENDDLSSISSGSTYYDKTRFDDALIIIKKYRLEKQIPYSVLMHLEKGKNGRIPETPKKPKIKNKIIANNQNCIDAMKNRAKSIGIPSMTMSLYGDIEKCVKKIEKKLPKEKNTCLIFGGEPTVNVVGKGKGGRNQELVLRLLKRITADNLIITSIGTDGIDGNTLYAGAIYDTKFTKRKSIESFLKNNNSNAFFKKFGGLIKTGPTHTNLQDIGIIFRY